MGNSTVNLLAFASWRGERRKTYKINARHFNQDSKEGGHRRIEGPGDYAEHADTSVADTKVADSEVDDTEVDDNEVANNEFADAEVASAPAKALIGVAPG